MAEKNGAGFRERVQFDEPLWREIEVLSDHLRLKPAEVIRMLTAVGVAQFKGLTMMSQMQAAIAPAIQQTMEDDFERMTGVPASSPVVGTAPKTGGSSAPGRKQQPPDDVSRVELPPSYLRGL